MAESTDRPLRVATVATGGVGGFLAVKLTAAGHQVATIARGAHLEAIRDRGLRLRHPGGESLVRPWRATDDPAEVGPVDAAILAVKGDALDSVARACRPLLGPGTLVVPFLNGVEAAPRLVELLGPDPVGNGVAYVSASVSAPGEITQTGTFARFVFAERDSRASARVGRLRDALRAAGVEAPATDDIMREVWSKFVFFSALSGVTAAARCRMRDVFAHPELERLFAEVVAETAALARASGAALPEDAEARAMAFARGLPGEMRASTAVDLEAGRPVETRWINGAVARLAAERGLPAPANRTIAALMSPFCG